MSDFFGEGWSEFTFRVFVAASRQTVFQHWATSGGLEKWFFEEAEYLDAEGAVRESDAHVQAGDGCRWKWHGWDHTHEGTITEVGADEFMEFTFPPAGTVRIQFVDRGAERTEVVLTQSGIPHSSDKEIKDFYYGCSLGWSFWLVNLKAFLEHGIVLNELDHPYTDQKTICQLVNH